MEETVMRRKIMVLFDPETEYAVRFMEYISRKGSIPLEIHVFTDFDRVKAYIMGGRAEILLVSERVMSDEISGWPVERIIILSEKAVRDPGERYPHIYKYQSSNDVVREVMACYGSAAGRERARTEDEIVKPVLRILGVYSPAPSVPASAFALALGQVLARSSPVLYMNFEGFSGLSGLFHENFEENVSDILYSMRQGEKDIAPKITAAVRRVGELDVIPPCLSGQELIGISFREWEKLFEVLRQETAYEYLVLDLGDGLGHLRDFLESSDRIYMPAPESIPEKVRTDAFESWIDQCGIPQVRDKIRRLRFSSEDLPKDRDRYAEQLVWTGLGRIAAGIADEVFPDYKHPIFLTINTLKSIILIIRFDRLSPVIS